MGTLSEVCGGPSSGLSLAGLKQHERDQEKESQQRSACFGHFSSTAAVYGNPERLPVREDDATVPTSPYGSSKLMTEIMLRDAGGTHGLPHVILRYFNVAGADPLDRTGQSTKRATHLIKVSVETALGLRPKVDVFGADYPTLTAPASETIFKRPISCDSRQRQLPTACGKQASPFPTFSMLRSIRKIWLRSVSSPGRALRGLHIDGARAHGAHNAPISLIAEGKMWHRVLSMRCPQKSPPVRHARAIAVARTQQ
jgi:NAD dependent epimerase/dehydratase family